MDAINRLIKIGFLLIAMFCTLPSDGQNKKAKKFYDDGLLSYEKADYGFAIVNFTEAIKAYSSYAIAYQSLGRSYILPIILRMLFKR